MTLEDALNEAEDRRKVLRARYEQEEQEIGLLVLAAIASSDRLRALRKARWDVRSRMMTLAGFAERWNRDAALQMTQYGRLRTAQVLERALNRVAGNAAADIATALAADATDRITEISGAVDRQINGLLTNAQLAEAKTGLTNATVWATAQASLREKFLQSGVTGFTDKLGRHWGMVTYADVVATGLLLRAYREGVMAEAQADGTDLCRLEGGIYETTCEVCEEWVTLHPILSMTGRTPGYPTVADAEEAGLFHPKCVHTPVPLTKDEETQLTAPSAG